MPSLFRALVLFAALTLLPLSPPARGQPPAPPGPDAPIDTLEHALPYVAWESRTHGPLIAISPQEATATEPAKDSDGKVVDDAQHPLLPPKGRMGLDAEVVARYFGQKLVRFSTLAIVAPPTMTILHTDMKPANPFQDARRPDQIRRLESTLSAAQWQLLGSPGGLGMDDLTREQQPLFDEILPETMTVVAQITTAGDHGSISTDDIEGSARTLTPVERAGVRLHLQRQAEYSLVNDKNLRLFELHPPETPGAKSLSLKESIATDDGSYTVFGQVVRSEEPNRLKPSDLDLTPPFLHETWIPLTAAKTVGDLMRVASEKTGLELYADGHLARLPVYLSAENRLVRASDLLEALCWALMATYRKVGPVPGGDPKDFAYVLTYDRTGILTLRGRIGDWARRGENLRDSNNYHFDEQIAKLKPGQYLHFGSHDPSAPTTAALQARQDDREKLAQSETPFRRGGETIPIGSLTTAQRSLMSDGLKKLDSSRAEDPTVPQARADRVALSTTINLSYVLPGIGEILCIGGMGDESVDPKSTSQYEARFSARERYRRKLFENRLAALRRQPLMVSRTILRIAPASVEAAEPLFAAARSVGVSEVWIDAPDTSAGRKRLAACVAAGAVHGVKVGAVVSLRSVAPDDATLAPAAEDLNAFGETGMQWLAHLQQVTEGLDGNSLAPELRDTSGNDWYAPESSETRRRVTQKVREIAAIPGLADITLHAVGAPGRAGDPQADFYNAIGSDFGFTIANRRTFLRKFGYDPLDINERVGDGEYFIAVSLDRYDDDDNPDPSEKMTPEAGAANVSPIVRWNAFCAQAGEDFLRAVHTDSRKGVPALPLYLGSSETDAPAGERGAFQRWKEGEPVPFAASANAPSAMQGSPPSSQPASPEADTLLNIPVAREFADQQKQEAIRIRINTDVTGAVPFPDYLGVSISQQVANNKLNPTRPPGIVLDFTGVDLEKVAGILKGVEELVKFAPGRAKPIAPASAP